MTSDMANVQKKIFEGNCTVDRLSSLPDELIECIMNFMSVRDAARTCMLSTRWRYVWAHHPSLVLDSEFECSKRDKERLNIVRKILQHRAGYIRTFDLQVASSFTDADIDSWLLSLSSGGLKELRVECSHYEPYKVPCSVYSSSDLIKLTLSKCIIRSGCFTNIMTLSLVDVAFDFDGVLTAPLLTYLRIESCDDILDLDISAPRLKSLRLCENEDLNLKPFLKCTGIEYASILCGVQNFHVVSSEEEEEKEKYIRERYCLVKLLASWPRLSELEMDGRCLKYLTAGSIPPRKLCQLNLTSFTIDLDLNSKQMPWILCILKNSPLLQTFDITFGFYIDFDWTPIIDESRISLDRLHTVILRNFNPELIVFAKILLQCAPVLKKMLVEEDKDEVYEFLGDRWTPVKILRKLLPLQHEFPNTMIDFGPCP